MANDFYTAENLAALGLELIGGDLNLAQTVNRSYESNFGGGKGSAVNIRKPATLKARTRTLGSTAAITTDDVSEDVVSVSLTDEIYSAVPLTDAEMTLQIEDFGRQVLKPQTDAIVYDVEALVSDFLGDVTPDIDATWTADGVLAPFAAARKELRKNGVRDTGRFAAVGVNVYAALLEKLTLQVAGSTDALRDGSAGVRVSGFTVVENNSIDDDLAVFYHRDAVHLAVRAPVVPQGVTFGASMAANGMAIRAIRDYDASTLQDRSVLSTFVGIDSLGMVQRQADGTNEVYVPVIAAAPGA